MPYFGNTTPGTSQDTTPMRYMVGSRLLVPADAGRATAILARIWARYVTTVARAKFYADNNGVPGALLAETAEVPIGISEADYRYPVDLQLTPGAYIWVFVHVRDESRSSYSESTLNESAAAWDLTYPINPNPFTLAYNSLLMRKQTIYVEYTVAGPPPTRRLTLDSTPIRGVEVTVSEVI